MEEAVKAYHLALEERTRVPLEWAETVYNWARAEWIIADLVSTQAPQQLNAGTSARNRGTGDL